MSVIYTLPEKSIFVNRAKEMFSEAGSKLKGGGGVDLAEFLTSK